MEFWGTEVAPGEPKVCHPGDEMYCHVSQAALGPGSNGKSERVVLRVETGGKDVVLGTLSTGKCDQMALDLIFDREFKLSHTGTACSVYFCGYKTEKGEPEEFDSEEDEDEEESEEEEAPDAVPMKANGDSKPISAGKALADAAKKIMKSPFKPKMVDDEADEGDDSDEDDDDDEDDEDDGSDEESDELDEDEDESDDEEESEDEEMASPEVGKKRPLKEGYVKTPASGKKARVDTPGKPAASPGKKTEKAVSKVVAAVASTASKATPVSGSKKGKEGKDHKTPQKSPVKEVPPKTPKSAAKTPAAKSDSTPGSAKKGLGPHRCEACNRAFATEAGASQHMTAKHGAPGTGK